jgi:hypothetical protein
MRKLRQQGKAMPPNKPGGGPRFPVRNASDLDNAIRAVGRASPHTDAQRAQVRKYIMSRAKALGLSSKIPDTWGSDGSLKSGSGDSSSSSDSKSKRVDPDNDGDNDATPSGDTDHSHWTAGGKQKKALPGRPMPPKRKGG